MGLVSLIPDALVEERIQAAIRRGDFDNLPGAGRPLALDDDPLVPPEVRIAHRILKNAGCVPPELLERRAIVKLEAALSTVDDDAERAIAIAKLAVMRSRLSAHRGRSLAQYERRIIDKLAGT